MRRIVIFHGPPPRGPCGKVSVFRFLSPNCHGGSKPSAYPSSKHAIARYELPEPDEEKSFYLFVVRIQMIITAIDTNVNTHTKSRAYYSGHEDFRAPGAEAVNGT